MTDAPSPREMIDMLWEKLDDSPYALVGIPSQDAHSEPMALKFDDDFPNRLFIYTNTDNRLTQGMARDPNAMIEFASKGHDFFACMKGTLSRVTDPDMIDRFWNNTVAAWYEGGRDDPKLAMLCVELQHAEMWEADMSIGGVIKMLFGGKVDESEMGHLETAM